jgi:NADH dehydrogenase FAD-containing subunit
MENYREKSFWLSTAGDYKENPPLKGDIKVDIAIVGGGFTGLSTAYFLKKESPIFEGCPS